MATSFRMPRLHVLPLIGIVAVGLVAADPGWKVKPMASWTEDDARQILSDSPWAKTVKAAVRDLQTEDQRREGGNMGQPTGIGFDGITDNRPKPKIPTSALDMVKPDDSSAQPPRQLFTLRLRWKSALPIRVAELKSHIVDPSTGEDDGYRVSVYGVPGGNLKGDPRTLGDPLKKQALLRREGKKDMKPLSVEVFQGENGLVVVYLFPLSGEISTSDRRVEFDAQIGRLSFAQFFNVEDMRFQGKLEL